MKIKKMLFFFVFLFSFIIYKPVFAETGVDIQNVEITGQRGEVVVGDLEYHDNVIESSLMFNELNDFVLFNVTLENHDDVAYQLQDIEGSFSQYLSIYSTDIDAFIEAGETKVVPVRVIYDKLAMNQDVVSLGQSTLTFLYTEKITNPETGFHSISIVFLLLAIGLFPAMFFKIRKRFIVLLFIFVPLIAFAYQEVDVQMVLRDVKVKGRMMEYTISIDDGSGNVQHVTRTYGQTIEDLPEPERNGYTFDHWEDENGNSLDHDTIVEGNMNIVAKYNTITYSITYDLDHGSVSGNPETYTIEDRVVLVNPTRAGYTFTGWSEGDSETVVQHYVITPGHYGNKTLVAHWTPSTDVSYTVIHKQMTVDGSGYEVFETEHLSGTADSPVTPSTKTYTGFTSPNTQTVTINPEGTTEVVYNYDRIQYTFTITDRTYVNSNTTPNGTYYYGTTITLSAKTRNGYSFHWSDGSEAYNRTITLTDNKTLSLEYSSSDNTPYTVNLYFMDLDGAYEDSPTTSSTLYGTTGESITPNVIDYDGFETPSSQTKTLSGDGDTVFDFYYERRKYEVTFENYYNLQCYLGEKKCYATSGGYLIDPDESLYAEESTTLEFYYGTALSLKAHVPKGYDLSWSQSSSYVSFDESEPYRCTLTVPAENVSFGPIYTPKMVSYTIYIMVSDTADGSFDEFDTQTGTALAGTTLTLDPPNVSGYRAISSSQSQFISGNGDSSFTFQYVLDIYSVTFTNTDYMSCSYSISGETSDCYQYGDGTQTVSIPNGSEISLQVTDDAYDVSWSSSLCSANSSTCSFTLSEDNLTIGPTLEPKDVTYTVCDELMLFDDDSYYTNDSMCYTDIGKHGTDVTPEVSSYTGFISPEANPYTLDYHRSANNITYRFKREQYTFEMQQFASDVKAKVEDPALAYYTDYSHFGGSNSVSSPVYYGKLSLYAPDFDCYVFDEWSDGVEDRERVFAYYTSAMSLYPLYSYILTISYDYEYVEIKTGDYYQDAEEVNQIASDVNTIYLRVKEKDGYHFVGWSNGANTETISLNLNSDLEDLTIYPIFEIDIKQIQILDNQYVQILLSGFDYEDALPGYSLGVGQYLTLKAINREDDRYKFRKWIVEPEFDDDDTTIDLLSPNLSFDIKNDVSIKPYYSYFYYLTVDSDNEYVEYATTEDFDHCEEAKVQNIVFAEEPLYLRVKDKVGYTFTGWSNGETQRTITIDLNSDITIHPIFVSNASGLSYHKTKPDVHLLNHNLNDNLYIRHSLDDYYPNSNSQLLYDDRMRYIL